MTYRGYTMFNKKSCRDCLRFGMCGDPKATNDGSYCCNMWEWRYE